MLKVGVFGTGHLGKFHAENWARLAKRDTSLKLSALCDPSPAGALEAKKYAAQFPKVTLFKLSEVAGTWTQVQAKHFADGGLFDLIYQPGK